MWRNNGDLTFTNTSIESGIANDLVELDTDWSYTPNFSDIDSDGDGDLLMTSDLQESQVYRNNDDGTFTRITDRDVIVDQNGMGTAVGDYDNDGDMDWFVTSIHNLDNVGGTRFGNRLYRNDGTGTFTDITDDSGVANGGWGWGACAAHIAAVVPTGGRQVREMGGSNNYLSHNPYEVHFGLGAATQADITVTWPDGSVSMQTVQADQLVTITHPNAP